MSTNSIIAYPSDAVELNRLMERLEDLRRPFLDLSPDKRKNSTIANRFLEPVRDGLSDPRAIVRHVERKANDAILRTVRWGREPREVDEFLAEISYMCGWEAFQMAEWALLWEGLTNDQRAAIKAERSRPFVEAWVERTPYEQRMRHAVRWEKWVGVRDYLHNEKGMARWQACDLASDIIRRWVETGEVPEL